MTQRSYTMEAPCTFCGKSIDLKKRGLKEVTEGQNIYCNKSCMGKAQTQRATLKLQCAYCQKDFDTLKGRHSETNIFCNQQCAFAVRKDRYLWTTLYVLSSEMNFLSADQIRERLKSKKVDLTPMRIATRISSSPMVEVNKESEPFTYRMKDEYRKTPWKWHTSKYYRKLGVLAKDYHANFN